MVNGQGQLDLTSIWFSGLRRLSRAYVVGGRVAGEGERGGITDLFEFDKQRSGSGLEVQKSVHTIVLESEVSLSCRCHHWKASAKMEEQVRPPVSPTAR